MMTPWGYEAEDIPPIITPERFHALTGLTYIDNPRIGSALLAASQAVRNYCGWHICPAVECTAHPDGGGKVLRLPAGYVSEITKVTEDGEELSEGQYEWRRDGLLRRAQFKRWSPRWDGIEVKYTAGYEASAVPDLTEAVCAITAGVLSVSAGVIVDLQMPTVLTYTYICTVSTGLAVNDTVSNFRLLWGRCVFIKVLWVKT